MSKQSNINSDIYEFEFGLVNTKPGAEIYLPLTKGSIDNLIIEDSLAFFGYGGSCTINNFYGILQQLNVLDVTGINCLYISIKDSNLSKSKTNADASIAFLAFLTKGVEDSINIIDKGLSFSFEEYFVAKLKTESIYQLPNDSKLNDTPGKLIHTLLKHSNKESVDDITTNITIKDAFVADAPNNISLAGVYKKGKTTLYDIICKLYQYVTYTGDIAGPGLLTGVTVLKNGVLQRKLVLRPLAEYIKGFYIKYNQKAEDLHEYVTEEFVIGSANNSAALNTNFIDNYSFIHVDQGDVLENKWIDTIVSGSGSEDITSTATPTVTYEGVKYDFATQMLAGNAANLPTVTRNNEAGKSNRRIVHKNIDDANDTLTKSAVVNIMMKSFIYDNKHLTFSVPGKAYRQSGKFIKINYKGEGIINKATTDDSMDGYWFIISVKHVFKGDFYTNEIVCAKLHTKGTAVRPGANISNIPAGIYKTTPETTPTPALQSALNSFNNQFNPNVNPGVSVTTSAPTIPPPTPAVLETANQSFTNQFNPSINPQF